MIEWVQKRRVKMAFKLSDKTKDYITIWNEAIAGIYMAFSVLMIGSMISSIQSCMELKAKYKSSAYIQDFNCGISLNNFDSVLLVIMIVVMFAAGISNFFYTRRFFRDGNIKMSSGYIATISLAASNLYLVYLLIRTLVETSEARSISILSYISGASWMTWVILIAVIISLVVSILAVVNVFTWSPITIESEEGGSKKEPEIAADVATHAMGHPAPTAPVKKELPPMLNAEPDAPETQPAGAAEHKIVQDRPIMAQGGATQEIEQPVANIAAAPATPATSAQPTAEKPADPTSTFGQM